MMFVGLALSAALLNPAVDTRHLERSICAHGWAAAQRPPPTYIRAWKRAHGARPGPHRAAGARRGGPYAPNLQLQTKAEAHRKDLAENRQHRAVCSGRVSLRDAQAQMAGWRP
jgi:hypothetical protein